MLAFALHGFAEGMALGVQEDTDSVGLMIIAIAMHKWAEAMSIGLSFQKSGMPKKYCMMYIVAFSFSSPVGIGVGWASEVLLPEAITAYLLAFSTGTFLYLGASDAIVEEFAHSSGGGGALRRWIKLAFYMAGAVLIFLISVYFDKDGGADSVGLMIIAIAMHKWAEAMSIGLSFQKSGMPKKYCMMYIVAFSFSSPVGIGVGWASEVLLPEAITAYLLAFSTGTFLYLGASDAIVEEFAHSSGGGALRRWIKLAFYMAGAVLIFLISVYFDKDGGGDDSAGGGE
ncbi:zinc transporter, putative [Bodo saltans]|uniref:Zinc transporter, putative n=1 Tax=Bodo saltans TaxID=75058 RepID=A0A0S4JH52_BODSA|nr:zinc transporter, putative [Bodo saltans]|eukprot:CUG88570.1 zinc transporter, putative [Bodo saltans]